MEHLRISQPQHESLLDDNPGERSIEQKGLTVPDTTILPDVSTFITTIDTELARLGIRRDELAMMDHLCYRVDTNERYEQLRREIGQIAILIDQSEVSGRQISTYEFDEPIVASGWRVPYLELPAPKDGSPYPEGLEYAELVVIGNLERFIARHSGLAFDHKAMTKPINQEVSLKTDTISVKFHEQPLGAVVRIEQRLKTEGSTQ